MPKSKSKTVYPSSGGSYVRDPETGELSRNTKSGSKPAKDPKPASKGKAGGKSSGSRKSKSKSDGETPTS